MATNRWRGDAPPISQVDTLTFGTWDATSTYKFTINTKTISALGNVSGATNATTLATAFLALLNATTVPQEFKEVTWTNPSAGVIVGTAAKAGKPFVLTTSVSGGTGTFTSDVHTTVSSGPNDVSTLANWSTGALPVNTNDVVFDSGSSDALYGLDALVAVATLASITILPGYTGKIGLAQINVDSNSAPYFEYRQQYFQVLCTTVRIVGGGGRIKLDAGATTTTWNVLAKTQRADSNVPQLLLKGTGSNILNVNQGDVGVANYGGEVSKLVTLNIGNEGNIAGDAVVYLGTGVTLTTCVSIQNGGSLKTDATITAVGPASHTQYSGTSTWLGTAGVVILNLLGGTCVWSTTGTLGTATVSNSGSLDFSQDMRAKVLTNPAELYGIKASILDPNAVVNSGLLAVGFNQTSDVGQVNFGQNMRLTRSVTP